jgi:hypothetical protein
VPAPELVIEVESDLYDSSHAGWRRETEALIQSLEREGTVTRRIEPTEGTKGALSELTLNIVGSGAGELVAMALLRWVAGYRDRRVRIQARGESGGESITIQNMEVDAATIQELAARLEHLANPEDTAER